MEVTMEAGKDNNKEGGIFITGLVALRGIGYVARGGERGKERGPPEREQRAEDNYRLD